ncbi:6-phospho-3-hexuloisomerase [Paenibacillus glycanilyticus]|uniref:6-phospho-3-hexuloisomerase n=1 Tax=Paenibacillus glycanilyticus TaxID=126569 RepID=UPI0020422511|nr:6-phospho-3-hexuloisomerase [Paenibacillus glycanilyticus]MCM3628732.1 6-phospho-3-hexuloisomerase [Paenibacillus glycanilyticus]
MSTLIAASSIIQELERTLQSIKPGEIEALAKRITEAEKIFVAGAGRSGLMMRAFAMRLMHLGFRAYVVGETVTPGIAEGDLLLIGSGSGETKTLTAMASKAQSIGAAIGVMTIKPDSTLGAAASIRVIIPASTKDGTSGSSGQPMGTLFEQSLLLLLDAVVLNLMEQMELEGAAMYSNHANLE